MPCPLDRVNRQFKAQHPNELWVSDFTYVSTWQGWLYVAFVVDVFARRIVGWRVSRSMHTDFVLDALEQALARQPGRDSTLIHHSDRGSQYVSIRYSERLAEAGIEPSVGSRGDSDDNALAETINGLYKAELMHRRAPWKTKEAVELATLEWVSWFNHHRLLEPIGYIPPAEAEVNYYQWETETSDKRAKRASPKVAKARINNTLVAGPESVSCRLSVSASNATSSGPYLRAKLVRLARPKGLSDWVWRYWAISLDRCCRE